MDWKIFFSTFVIVFLAELGDKTQLTALAASSGTKSIWSVFAGASIALVLSTLIAVLVGSVLQNFIPLRVIRIAAGALFLVFGAILIISAIRNKSDEGILGEATIQPGLLSSLAIRSASQFEKNRAEGYLRMAESTSDEQLRALLVHISESENFHAQRLENLSNSIQITNDNAEVQEEIPYPVMEAKHDSSDSLPWLKKIIEEEQLEADFYLKLAQITHINSVKQVYLKLAQEEQQHLQFLNDYVERL